MSAHRPDRLGRQTDFFRAPPAAAPLPESFAGLAAMRPAGGFRLLLADPPWRFANYSAAGEAKNPSAHYACLDAATLARLPVAAVAADDAMLALWATFPTLPDAFALLGAWGFRYSGLLWCWRKVNPSGAVPIGPGYGTRKNLEPCLLAKRGRGLPVRDHGVRDWLESEWLDAGPREHSRKPDAQYERLDRLFGAVSPRLELFARQAWPGWTAWGDQVGKFEAAGRAPSERRADTRDEPTDNNRAEGAA